MARSRLRYSKEKRYGIMVKYRAISPISLGSFESKAMAIGYAACGGKFDRLFVVDNESGKIVWEKAYDKRRKSK